jgi:hypothetical protein
MNPYDPAELGRHDPELDRIAQELERQVAAMGGEPPLDLTGRILSAIDDEPMPSSRWSWLSGLRGPARFLAAASVLVVAITGALAIGSLIDQARQNVGGDPTPVVLPSPSETPAPSPSRSLTPSPSASASPSPTASPTVAPTTQPTASDDDDEVETPEPSESDDDNSGPGGGGGDDDNSGPGGGGGGG